MIKRKICMLGAFSVGKTSLVQQFVKSIFSEKYLTTVGVKIDKKAVDLDGTEVTLIIWDLQGEDSLHETAASYLRGTAGYLLVADGTRPETVETACSMQQRVSGYIGDAPFVLLLNKSDMTEAWGTDDETVAELTRRGWCVIKTSAKTGMGVESAFTALARETMGRAD